MCYVISLFHTHFLYNLFHALTNLEDNYQIFYTLYGYSRKTMVEIRIFPVVLSIAHGQHYQSNWLGQQRLQKLVDYGSFSYSRESWYWRVHICNQSWASHQIIILFHEHIITQSNVYLWHRWISRTWSSLASLLATFLDITSLLTPVVDHFRFYANFQNKLCRAKIHWWSQIHIFYNLRPWIWMLLVARHSILSLSYSWEHWSLDLINPEL